jgi:hypothetical protein
MKRPNPQPLLCDGNQHGLSAGAGSQADVCDQQLRVRAAHPFAAGLEGERALIGQEDEGQEDMSPTDGTAIPRMKINNERIRHPWYRHAIRGGSTQGTNMTKYSLRYWIAVGMLAIRAASAA